MEHCTKCGVVVGDNAAFCAACGAPQPLAGATRPPESLPPAVAVQSGLDENVAALLSYSLWWVTGLIFYLTDKRPFVRYHAAQSIVTFGGIHILLMIVGRIFGFGYLFGGLGVASLGVLLYELIQGGGVVLWVVCMIKAYQ